MGECFDKGYHRVAKRGICLRCGPLKPCLVQPKDKPEYCSKHDLVPCRTTACENSVIGGYCGSCQLLMATNRTNGLTGPGHIRRLASRPTHRRLVVLERLLDELKTVNWK